MRRRLWMVLPALVLMLGAACGQGSDGDGVASAGGGGGGDGGGSGENGGGDGGGGAQPGDPERMQAFVDCMRGNGVDLPDPDPNQPGLRFDRNEVDIEDPAVQAALEACREHLPNGGQPPPQDADSLAALGEFVACMRDNGVDMPDPAPDGSLQLPDGLSPESDEFQTAMEACREKLAGGRFMFRGGGGGGQ